MKDNSVFKKDETNVKTRKRSAFKKAEKQMFLHLNDFSIETHHGLYSVEKLFPAGLLVWENGTYVEGDVFETNLEDQVFLEKLRSLQTDMVENHYVGVNQNLRRDGTGKHARPDAIEVGHIVVFKLKDAEEGQLPWCVGEVMCTKNTPILTICEYGSMGRNKKQATSNIKWGAIFRGTEMAPPPGRSRARNGRAQKQVMTTRDEFHLNAAEEGSTSVFKPLLLEIEAAAVAEWDDEKKMLKNAISRKSGRKASGRQLKKWVLSILAKNTLLDWEEEA
jgi:hypothetical protein